MKEYTSNQRKKMVLKINKVKNKEILAAKYLVLKHIVIKKNN